VHNAAKQRLGLPVRVLFHEGAAAAKAMYASTEDQVVPLVAIGEYKLN
jgi:hypothetical protein